MDSRIITGIEELRKDAVTKGRWADRIMSQMAYAARVSQVNGGMYDGIVAKAFETLSAGYVNEGTVTKGIAAEAEDILKQMSGAAKKYVMLCASHAHIDMNWMWRYDETVAITLDTFRTVLNLMKEYPEFKFSQSQASVYRMVEEYDTDMLQEIKTRVNEGRWEVTASAWVETDKNMPSGESLARHILYTKKYLSELLGLDPDSLQLDFEPDTFGHSRNVPEILANGGVKYYYHCRGFDGHNIYRWKAQSGNSVIVYRDPFWYNAMIGDDPHVTDYVPFICSKYGIDTILKVYGIGDHGGGPTRRDIEKLIEMGSWPVFPTIRFGTFGDFFKTLETVRDKLPVVEQELNFMFTGCYASQSRIKLANRISEAKMADAEAYGSISAAFAGGSYPRACYEETWRKLLFSHFHDILTGSGVIDTREYAMGQFQQILAAANTGISKALRNIAPQIDTSSIIPAAADECVRCSDSEGAGAGYAINDFGVPQTERGSGKNRILHFFNPTAHIKREPVEITVWDWPGDLLRMEIKNADGAAVRHQVLNGKYKQTDPIGNYWGHKFVKLLVDAEIPAYGYSTYTIIEKDLQELCSNSDPHPRVEAPDLYVLENDLVKAVFDTRNASLLSITDKTTGSEMVDPKRPAGIFRLIGEDDCEGMTSWRVGRHMNVEDLHRNVKISYVHMNRNELRQWIAYNIIFGESRLDVAISLDHNNSELHFDVECDWRETARPGKLVPQLNFHMPLGYRCKAYKYDIPFGTITRDDLDMDVPANSWAFGIPENAGGKAVMVMTDSKYGFRGTGDSISITLIRSSYDPDRYPENYVHRIKFAVAVTNAQEDNASLIGRASAYCHPASFVSGSRHDGSLPLTKSFISVAGAGITVSSVKMPERTDNNANNRIIARVYETSGSGTQAEIKFGRMIADARYVDLNENRADGGSDIHIEGSTVRFHVDAYAVCGICVEFEK